MNREIIEHKTEQDWLEARLKDVTSTEVAALYGLSPYLTSFELFHQKRDGLIVRRETNERMRWGTRLEAVIANAAAEERGWQIEPLKVYMRLPDARMGSSFDFKIKSASDGDGIMEIKNVDAMQFTKTWLEYGDGDIEAPEHIELQLQHQLEVSGLTWGVIVALVGGNTLKVTYRQRDPDVAADIRRKVAEFWARVEANDPPSPDYARDYDMIIRLHSSAHDGLVIDADPELDDLVRQYVFASKEAKAMDEVAAKYRAMILDRIGDASKVRTSLGTLSCGMVKPSQGRIITPDMVGTSIGGREGYRNFRFTPAKES